MQRWSAGSTHPDPAHRALDYLPVRHSGIYAAAVDAHARNALLSAVDVRPSVVSGTRRLVELVFSFTNRTTDVVEKLLTRVDVTAQFLFLVTKLSPYRPVRRSMELKGHADASI